MGKIWIETCLISARGVRGSPSLWKRQWYAVGWLDANNKYCTKVDASGNANPVWRTKFAVQVDDSDQDLALSVEVYSRDPVFLTEKLHGSATVVLKEFLNNSRPSTPGHEQVGSYQLRTKKSNKPRGFIDVSIRVSQDKEEPNPYTQGNEGGIMLDYGNSNSTTHLNTGSNGTGQAYPQQMAQASFQGPGKQAQTNVPYSHPVPFPANYANPYVGGPSYPAATGPTYPPPRTIPPQPFPPSNVGYIPTFYPSNGGPGPSYFNMPSSSSGAAPRQRGPPGFAVGAGAGALAAGAVMFGDNLKSGFDFPSGLGGDPSLTIAIDPPF
ncbi:hypothetical protein RJT34_11886 [Clitoria ternatea]|uniref:C2 domain-containing protein n=1 Tax=Clitoria ternatea TaxID=43366 RepID=A0AAN9JMN4_CLITE